LSHGDFRDRENAKSYAMNKGVHGNVLQQENVSWQMIHLTGVEIAVASS